MTKNYIILIEQPYVMNASKVVGSVLAKTAPICSWLEWKPEFGNKFFIVEKETGKVLKADVVSADPFFFLHIINAFEINDHIILDITTFPNANSITTELNLEKLRRMSIDASGADHPSGERFVIPLVDLEDCKEGENMVGIKSEATAVRRGKQLVLTAETVTEKGLELPVINKKFLSKKTSFYYATGSASKGYFENSVCKVHASKKETILWRESEHYYLGEPMFVQAPNSQSEDDGVLISAVTDNRENTEDFLLFLDAKTMKELGRAYFKDEISYSVHGIFIEDESSAKK
jgi:carotenoid cleavage dioxygenase-like enzyme